MALKLGLSLNPLSTGKSVQTAIMVEQYQWAGVLIPYLQGSLFRHIVPFVESTSRNRAVLKYDYHAGDLLSAKYK